MYLFLITLLTPFTFLAFTFLAFGEVVYVAVDFAEIDGYSLVLALPDYNTDGMILAITPILSIVPQT